MYWQSAKGVVSFLILLAVVIENVTQADNTTLTAQDAEDRIRMARQIAREQNNASLVELVEELGKRFKQNLPADAETQLSALETKVGIDPGGWSMAGQPLFHGTRDMVAKSRSLGLKLDEAMKSNDPRAVRATTAELLRVLGDQAGVPDGRRSGRKPSPLSITEASATKLFLDALVSQGRTMRQLSEGTLLPDQMVRVYADVLIATNTIRPFAAKHQSDALLELDKLTRGVAAILVKVQQPEGHFPFPDLRGKNIRFGEMTERQLQASTVVIRDGWLVSVDPGGGSQFDTGLCGAALLDASELHANEDWKQAGLRAADWALRQSCCSNFNYNAFSVSLLSHAYRVTQDAKYLDGAIMKYRVGVAPGQAPNGRWLDAHNARTVYHVIILRALGDLASVLPADRATERAELDRVIVPAIKTLLDEFDAMGITVEALPELQTLAKLYPDDMRLRNATQSMAASIISKCTDGKRTRMGSQPNQLAATPAVGTLIQDNQKN